MFISHFQLNKKKLMKSRDLGSPAVMVRVPTAITDYIIECRNSLKRSLCIKGGGFGG